MSLVARLADLAQREAPQGALVAVRADGAVLVALAGAWSLEFWLVWRAGGVCWRGEERREGRVTRMEEGLCEWDCLEWAVRRLRAGAAGDFGRRATGVSGK